jgi:very-short-patch-repair endonuclease
MARLRDLDDLVDELAEHQHGAFALRQLPPGWCSTRLAAERSARNEWWRIVRGVYGLPGRLDAWTVPAGWCLYSPAAALGFTGAAEWWRFDGDFDRRTELVVPQSSGVHSPLVRRTSDLEPWEVRLDRPDGCLRVTDPTRTLIDLGACITAPDLERAVESAFRLGLTSEARLRARARQLRRPGRSGPAALLEVLDGRPPGGGAGSDGEVILLQLLRDAGVPTPVRQLRIGSTFFDLGWPEHRVLVELDGDAHRGRGRTRRDARKQNAAVLTGWTVLRFTWDRIDEEPDAVVAEVLAALCASKLA